MSTAKSTNQSSKNEMTLLDKGQLGNMIDSVAQVQEQALERSKEAVDRSVAVVKEYPIHSAIGAGVLGFVAGVITNKILK